MHEVKVETGEENEDTFWKCRSKLYRWAAGSEWKERGLGEAKLLQHKETKKIRFLLRQEKTLKIVANHYGAHARIHACLLLPACMHACMYACMWKAAGFTEAAE